MHVSTNRHSSFQVSPLKTLLLASVALVISSAFAIADEVAFKATLVPQAVLPAGVDAEGCGRPADDAVILFVMDKIRNKITV